MKIFLHLKDSQDDSGRNISQELLDFVRLPITGEYIALADSGSLYKVVMVWQISLAANTPYSAEVYAVKVNDIDVIYSEYCEAKNR